MDEKCIKFVTDHQGLHEGSRDLDKQGSTKRIAWGSLDVAYPFAKKFTLVLQAGGWLQLETLP